jgi:hypothetical protein
MISDNPAGRSRPHIPRTEGLFDHLFACPDKSDSSTDSIRQAGAKAFRSSSSVSRKSPYSAAQTKNAAE